MPVSNSYNLVSEWLPASLLPLYPGCYEIERIDGERQIRRYELAPGGEPGQGAAWGEDVRRWRGMQAPKLATRQRLSKNVYAERQANDKRRAQRDALWVARGHVARAADASPVRH